MAATIPGRAGDINARFISELGDYGLQWLADPRFLAGVGVFAAGFVLNIHSDNILLRLRKSGEADGDGYSIPRGGAFRYVSCPNYLGELLEWGGWALATWSPGGLAFFTYTAANLIPRALGNHQWYRERFEGYPPNRKAVMPGFL
ncbi:3-oxo-5-alpha-steroid 4-dehydrogenase [Candidatus Palauibacter sp.]|uniref:3-oxo-5-alpha-steroid 4-dehydrogenase n=1 Tax=Candidatus Palauibacter sp. TaxID=3101350 RepID=UPI003AF228A4